jgi:hypothetical protein
MRRHCGDKDVIVVPSFVVRLVRCFAPAMLMVVSLVASAQPSSAAVIYPWCAFMGRLGENCGFSTYQQCRETISGIGGYCGINPWYAGNPPGRVAPRTRR